MHISENTSDKCFVVENYVEHCDYSYSSSNGMQIEPGGSLAMRHPTSVQFVRKLRGGSQAHLIQADDNHFYALKSPGNPQGTRVLVNEFLVSKILMELGIATPKIALVSVTPEFLHANPEVGFEFKSSKVSVRPGLHLGSRYEVPPDKVAIYDFIPEVLISQINNAADFLGVFIADQWLCNSDARQFVFFRETAINAIAKPGFRAVAIDHGFCLGGTAWRLFDSPLTGLYCQQAIYRSASADEMEGWLHKLSPISEERLRSWVSGISAEWIVGQHKALELLLANLIRRKDHIPRLIETAVAAHPRWFPGWTRGKGSTPILVDPE